MNLITGFVTFILISLFIYSEFTWDKHNWNYNRIYRLQLFMDQPENIIQHTWSVTAALSRHELTNIPEIEKIVLMHDVGDNNKDGVYLSIDKKNQYKIRWGYYADPSVFEIFTFDFIAGDPSRALEEPYSIVLSESVAEKLFPESDAMGKQVYGENKVSLKVTGIFKNLPRNSNWCPSFILPMSTFTPLTGWKDYENDYLAYSFFTYVMLKPNTSAAAVDSKIYNALEKYRKEHHPYLRHMKNLHLNPFFRKDIVVVLSLLSFIALLILILTSVNYINLQTARSTARLKEIGIKKTVGFSKNNLYLQFLFESVIVSFLAGLLALIVAQLVLPAFNYIIGSSGVIGVGIPSSVFTQPGLIMLVIAVSILTGLISGLYPAYIISSFNPINALKEKVINNPKNGIGLKKILVTAQFVISLLLLTVGFIIYRQTQHMVNGDLGFKANNIVFANIVTNKNGSFEPLWQKLLKHPEIKDACFSDYIPFIIPGGDDLTWEGSKGEEKVFLRDYKVTYNFFSTYNIPVVKGRGFSPEFGNDKEMCMVNETAVRVFGWDNPIGKHIIDGDRKIEVIGVAGDFIAQSMHNPVEPHWYRLQRDSAKLEGIYSIQLATSDTKKAIEIIKTEFSDYFPEDAFEFTHIRTIIESEAAAVAWVVIRNISVFFAVLSIIISSAGLFGLVMFFARKKMKEISIRKVLGFSIHNLYFKLSSEFLWLLLIANIITWPAAYLIYTVLPGANKYQIQIWEFLLASAIIFAIAIGTISYHIVKLIRQNPVETLKYE